MSNRREGDHGPVGILPTPTEMIAYLDEYVVGQIQAKRDLAVAVYNHYLALASADEGIGGYEDFGKQHVLLVGPTGTGKTYMVKLLARMLGVPYGFSSATSLVETGYVGQPVDSVVQRLLGAAGEDAPLAERGIVFIDEIDKIRRGGGVSSRDVSGEGVQNGLLTLLDGRTVGGVDSGRVLFVCTGAFVGLTDIVRARLGLDGRVGFESAERAESREDDAEVLAQFEPRDVVAYGFIPEFVGRFSTLSAVHPLSKEDMVRILTETKNSILEKQRMLFALHGLELEVTEDGLDAIAVRAIRSGTGARALTRVVLKALDDVDWRLPEIAEQGVRKVVIDAEAVEQCKPTLVGEGARALPSMVDELRARAFQPGLPRTGLPGKSTGQNELPRDRIKARIEEVKAEIGWPDTKGTARRWWTHFEHENESDLVTVLGVVEELKRRGATIEEFFDAYLFSDSDDIEANLHYLDYLKRSGKGRGD